LNKEFTGVFTTEGTTDVPVMDGDRYPDMRYFTVGTERDKKLLLNLNTNRALTYRHNC
jgi:hypothetical protein